MNLFIDTSVIYTDPFWKRNFANQILESAKDERAVIFISEVVYRELREKYRQILEKEINSLKNPNSTIRKISRKHQDIEIPNLENYLKDFDIFYDTIFQYRNIILLKPDKEYFNELLDRAIERRKPFSETKSEFKDAVIWLTYYKHANKFSLDNCHLITSNISDFAASSQEIELHPDLKKDYDKFSIHKTLEEFYKKHKDFIDQPIIEFAEWIESEKIDNNYIFDLLFESYTEFVYGEINSKFENIDPSILLEEDYLRLRGGYINVDEVEWYECRSTVVDIVKDYAIISGVLTIYVQLDLFGYNPFGGFTDDKSSYVASLNKELKVSFNFTYNKSKQIENFDITNISE